MNNQHIMMEALKGKSLLKRFQYEQPTHQDGSFKGKVPFKMALV